MNPKLVATDLDGTIVRTDRSISARTREALQAIEASGRIVVFVSGRPPRWLGEIADATGHTGIAICANGALQYDLHTEALLGGEFLRPETMRGIVKRLREAIPGLLFAIEYGDQFGHEPAYHHHLDLYTEPVILSVEEMIERPAAKLLARSWTVDADSLLEQGIAAAGDLATFTHSMTESGGLLEISALGVTKASGLAAFAAEHGIAPEEVWVFGDMPNDLPMFDWAGHSVAVANAHPRVREAADEITASNDEDGVALVLERLLAPPPR
ncbi:MAG TPA: HAD family hydrolase [Mycobacteriales bacterium]|nr:HAD family hydrolase [Mycobacteriales bacterium]